MHFRSVSRRGAHRPFRRRRPREPGPGSVPAPAQPSSSLSRSPSPGQVTPASPRSAAELTARSRPAGSRKPRRRYEHPQCKGEEPGREAVRAAWVQGQVAACAPARQPRAPATAVHKEAKGTVSVGLELPEETAGGARGVLRGWKSLLCGVSGLFRVVSGSLLTGAHVHS